MTVVPLHSTTSTTSTTTTSTTGCCSSPSSISEFSSIVTLYSESVTQLTQTVYEALFDYFIEYPPSYLRYAIKETACAPRPSFLYLRAIMNRLIKERPDPDQLTRPRVREQSYTQREYTNTVGMTPHMLERLRELQQK